MRDLLQQILDGEYAPGEWLPSEVQMSEERDISRTTVRGAIEALRTLGILHVRHGRGQFVRPEDDWNVLDIEVLAAIMAARRVDLVGELIDCQALIEAPAAALAAERATDDAVAELGSRHEAVVRAAGGRRRRGGALEDPVVAAEIDFHRSLARMAGNRPLQRMLMPIGTALALARHELAAGEEEALVRALRRTLRAIEARDSEAARKSVEARVTAARRWLKRAG
jgi:GntR family transcriptional regulator, transcriptional repressor for pyruvate dehydrogenase complex